jgi:hypothetical protein
LTDSNRDVRGHDSTLFFRSSVEEVLMKKVLLLGGFLALLTPLAGCSSDSTDSQANGAKGGDEDSGNGDKDGGSSEAPTWSYIYATYFSASSAGGCADTLCHGRSGGRGNLQFTNKDNAYTQFTTKIPENFSRPLIDLDDPSNSLLISETESPVSWFNPDGTMPEDNTGSNETAKAEITAWVLAGANKD